MKKAIIVAVVAFTGLNVYAQETEQTGETSTERKNQISLNVAPVVGLASIRGRYEGRQYLQYRREVKDGFFIKGDLSYRRVVHSSLLTMTPNAGDIMEETDTSRSFRAYGNDYHFFSMRIGAERHLGEREIFTLGVNVINGLTKRNNDYAEVDQILYEPGQDQSIPEDVTLWIPTCDPYNVDPADYCPTKLTDVYYYSTGLSANINLNMDITERWMVSLIYEAQYMYHFVVDQQTQADFPEVALYANNHGNYGEFRGNVDLLLRYRF